MKLSTLFTCGLLSLTTSLFSAELIDFKIHGAKDKRVNIAIVGDGYTSSQKSLFMDDMQKVYDAIVSDPALARYVEYHNFYGIWEPSQESGADADNISSDADCSNGTSKNMVNTAFDSQYCVSNIQRLLVSNSSKVNTAVNSVLPEQDIAMVVVNTSRYGGSGGAIAVANRDAPQIIAHEIGHSFVSLKDEYDYTAGYTPREGINATAITTRENIRWSYWIESTTPLPTPETSANNGIVGLFEGANYRASGWFRPENQCRMKSNGVDLCAVCAEAWILKIHELVSPLESHSDNSSPLTDPASLNITVQQPAGAPLDIKWYQDNQEIESARGSTSWTPNLPAGSYSIWARVEDTTLMVRDDPNSLLKDAVNWDVTLTATTSLASEVHNQFNGSVLALPDQIVWNVSQASSVEVFNSQGHKIAAFQIQGQGQSPWPQSLPTGQYYLQIQNTLGAQSQGFVIP